MDYKKSYLLFNICLYTGLVLCLVSLVIKVNLPGVFGIVILLSGIFQTAIFYRCPHCRRALNFRGKRPEYCPECGHPLDFE